MREVTKCHVGRWVMGSTPLEYCWFIYKIGARTGRLTGQFETYAQLDMGLPYKTGLLAWRHENNNRHP